MTLKPLGPDDMWCVWHNPASGTFEWICGPDAATELLSGGMTKINGEPCRVDVVGVWPKLKGIQVRATTSTAVIA
jgi:hypothetical protein